MHFAPAFWISCYTCLQILFPKLSVFIVLLPLQWRRKVLLWSWVPCWEGRTVSRQDLPSKRKWCCLWDGSGSWRPAEALWKPGFLAGLNTQQCGTDPHILLQEKPILNCPPDSCNIKCNCSLEAPCLWSLLTVDLPIKQKLDIFQCNLVHQVC